MVERFAFRLILDRHARPPDAHTLRMAVEGLMNGFLQDDRIVGISRRLEVDALVDVKVAIQGLDPRTHLVAALVAECRGQGLLTVGFEDA